VAKILSRLGAFLRRLSPEPYAPSPLRREDFIVAGLFAIAALFISIATTSAFDRAVFDGYDIYFESDPPRVISNMTDRWSDLQSRSHVHPIFSIMTFPFVRGLMALGLEPLAAIGAVMAACAAASAGLIYLSLKGIVRERLFAMACTAVFLASAAFIHWGGFLDTFAVADLTIAAMMFTLVHVRADNRLVWILASAATLSVTTTNWALGVVAAFFRLPFRRFVLTTVAALGLVMAIALVQNATFPNARLFFNPKAALDETRFVQIEREQKGVGRWTPWANLRSAVISSAVAPPPHLEMVLVDEQTRLPGLNNQDSPLLSTPLPGMIAAVCWLLLLAGGVWGAVLNRSMRPVALALGAYVASQLGLHLIYGEITFLYSLHFLPAMVGLAAFGVFTPAKRLLLIAAALFVVLGGYSNQQQFLAAAHLANQAAHDRPVPAT
jgi:hypothetical protein